MALAVALVATGLGARAAAQDSWEGEQGVNVVVTDEQGQPVSGVLVVFRFGEGGLRGPSLTTGDDGTALVEGLAAGEWQVDLRRESFMLVTSYLRLEPEKDPELAFSSRQRTGSYWAPLTVVFLAPGVDPGGGVGAGTVSPKKAAKQQAREERRLAKAAEREEKRFRRGRGARVVASVVPSQGDAPQPTRSSRAPAPRGRAAATGLVGDGDLLPAGACRECREGEWSLTTSIRVPAGGAPCSGDGPPWNDVQQALESAGLEGYVGGVVGTERSAVGELTEESRTTFLQRFSPWFQGEAGCAAIAVVLPAGSRFVGVRLQAGEKAVVADCLLGQECQIGAARVVGDPVIVNGEALVLVGTRFENASPDTSRVATLTVYFAPPEGWLPPN